MKEDQRGIRFVCHSTWETPWEAAICQSKPGDMTKPTVCGQTAVDALNPYTSVQRKNGQK